MLASPYCLAQHEREQREHDDNMFDEGLLVQQARR